MSKLPEPYYESDGIVIYNADCREILPLLEPGSVDLVLTDPPYGINYTKQSENSTARSYLFSNVLGDKEPFDPSALLRFPRIVMFGANHYADRLPSSATWIVWDKKDGGRSDINADCELAWTNLGGPARLYRHLWRGMIKASERHKRRVHPTQKPVALMSWILEQYTKRGDLILDPYMGSGPVAEACHLLNRRYLGIEIDEAYCRIAVQRLAQQVLPLEVAS